MRWAALALVALALTGCQTSAEKSAKLEKTAKLEAALAKRRRTVAERGLSVTRQSTNVKVSATAVVHNSEGTAAIVTLRNLSDVAQRDVPIEITVRDAAGHTIYTNDAPGLASALVSVALLPAHATASWIDDQVQAAGVAASVTAKVGAGEPVPGAIPRLRVEGAHLTNDEASGPELEGIVVNRSSVGQRELVVYALARRDGRTVAAGRAVIPQAEAGTSMRFQVFFIGSPQGAQLEISAPPSTLG